MEKLDEFMESLLNAKGVTDVDPEVRAELKKQMSERLLDQINRNAIMRLSEEKAEELTKLIESNPNITNEEVTKFIQDAGVDLSDVALSTMVQFRNFYLSGTGE